MRLYPSPISAEAARTSALNIQRKSFQKSVIVANMPQRKIAPVADHAAQNESVVAMINIEAPASVVAAAHVTLCLSDSGFCHFARHAISSDQVVSRAHFGGRSVPLAILFPAFFTVFGPVRSHPRIFARSTSEFSLLKGDVVETEVGDRPLELTDATCLGFHCHPVAPCSWDVKSRGIQTRNSRSIAFRRH